MRLVPVTPEKVTKWATAFHGIFHHVHWIETTGSAPFIAIVVIPVSWRRWIVAWLTIIARRLSRGVSTIGLARVILLTVTVPGNIVLFLSRWIGGITTGWSRLLITPISRWLLVSAGACTKTRAGRRILTGYSAISGILAGCCAIRRILTTRACTETTAGSGLFIGRRLSVTRVGVIRI
jgi:hypothetical protein